MRSASETSQTRLAKVSSLKYNPTFSVRGATLARSEGYCLCLDNEYIQYAQTEHFEYPSHSLNHRVPCCIDGWLNKSLDLLNNQQYSTCANEQGKSVRGTLTPRQRARKQSIFARGLLPRLVMSTKRKSPILHRFKEEDADGDKGHRDASIHDPHTGDGVDPKLHLPWEKRQRAVQFLNCDKSQAVKLITPPFQCGGVKGPITLFIVAIITEDGCFVSGRNSRFEFGHMYPLSNRDMVVDMSPICIASGNGQKETTDAHGRQQVLNGALSSSSDQDDDSCNSEMSMHCLCKFDSTDPFHPKDVTIDGELMFDFFLS